MPFETYVENVLPNEWIAGWDGDALKAGAVAVKSYAWYWVTHYGGYVGATAQASSCFDVTDDTSFQVYRANSAQARTTAAVQETWPYVLTQNGAGLPGGLRGLPNNSGESCGAYANGYQLSQWGTQNCVEASTGNKFPVILAALLPRHAAGDGPAADHRARLRLRPDEHPGHVGPGHGSLVHRRRLPDDAVLGHARRHPDRGHGRATGSPASASSGRRPGRGGSRRPPGTARR